MLSNLIGAQSEKAFVKLEKYLTKLLLLSKPKLEELSLYLVVSLTTISTTLVRKDNGVQLPVYFVSHSTMLIETRYLGIELLALAFLMSVKKL